MDTDCVLPTVETPMSVSFVFGIFHLKDVTFLIFTRVDWLLDSRSMVVGGKNSLPTGSPGSGVATATRASVIIIARSILFLKKYRNH